MLDQALETPSPDAVRDAPCGGRLHSTSSLRRFERRLDVVAEGQRQLGRGGDHACEADGGSHRDQGPDDLVEARTGGQRDLDVRLVGAGRRVDRQRCPRRTSACVFGSSVRGGDGVVARSREPTPAKRSSFSASLRRVSL